MTDVSSVLSQVGGHLPSVTRAVSMVEPRRLRQFSLDLANTSLSEASSHTTLWNTETLHRRRLRLVEEIDGHLLFDAVAAGSKWRCSPDYRVISILRTLLLQLLTTASVVPWHTDIICLCARECDCVWGVTMRVVVLYLNVVGPLCVDHSVHCTFHKTKVSYHRNITLLNNMVFALIYVSQVFFIWSVAYALLVLNTVRTTSMPTQCS